MQEPVPELIDLALRSYDEVVSVVPGSFSGGLESAPCLRALSLHRIPALLTIRLSASRLIRLIEIPHSRYISPVMAAAFSTRLSNIKLNCLEFPFPLNLAPTRIADIHIQVYQHAPNTLLSPSLSSEVSSNIWRTS